MSYQTPNYSIRNVVLAGSATLALMATGIERIINPSMAQSDPILTPIPNDPDKIALLENIPGKQSVFVGGWRTDGSPFYIAQGHETVIADKLKRDTVTRNNPKDTILYYIPLEKDFIIENPELSLVGNTQIVHLEASGPGVIGVITNHGDSNLHPVYVFSTPDPTDPTKRKDSVGMGYKIVFDGPSLRRAYNIPDGIEFPQNLKVPIRLSFTAYLTANRRTVPLAPFNSECYGLINGWWGKGSPSSKERGYISERMSPTGLSIDFIANEKWVLQSPPTNTFTSGYWEPKDPRWPSTVQGRIVAKKWGPLGQGLAGNVQRGCSEIHWAENPSIVWYKIRP